MGDKISGAFHGHLFNVQTKAYPDGFLCLVQNTKEGPRLDWRTFVQFKERHFETFLKERNGKAMPRAFRLMMRRTHTFASHVPDIDARMAVQLYVPSIEEPEPIEAFVIKASEAGKALAKIPWLQRNFCEVTLSWQAGTDPAATLYLQVEALRLDNPHLREQARAFDNIPKPTQTGMHSPSLLLTNDLDL